MSQLRNIIKKLIMEEKRKLNINLLTEDIDPNKMCASIVKYFKLDFTKPDEKGIVLDKRNCNIEIPVNTLPILFQPVFKSIVLDDIFCYITDQRRYIKLHYSWKHYSGSNGTQVQLISKDGKTWEIWN